MNSTQRNGLLTLLGLGALAFWKYKKSSPEDQQKVKDQLNTIKDNVTDFANNLKDKATNVANKASEEIQKS